MMGMRVVIIGAGPSGIVAAKSALECGLEPLVLERTADIGGIWQPHTGAAWSSMRTNLSRYTCMFSDFPWDNNTDEFPHRQAVFYYLQRYVEAFKLAPYLKYDCHVTAIVKNEHGWQVSWTENEVSQRIDDFDFVIVATGIFSNISIPPIPGLQSFKGQTIHASQYKNPEQFKNKSIAVIGGAYSGTEISADVATQAKVVFNIQSRPCWILPRYIPKTVDNPKQLFPLDLVFYKRSTRSVKTEIKFPTKEINNAKNKYFGMLCREQPIINPYLGIDPNSTEPPQVIISDTYLQHVKDNKILVTPGSIKNIDEHGIMLAENKHIAADAIIFCTGYQASLPFLEKSTLDIMGFNEHDQFQPLLLYKCTFHPELDNIAFVGMYRGPYFAVMELQARWASMVFARIVNLPEKVVMEKGIEEEKHIRMQDPRPQFPHGDYVGLADSIAEEIGVLPDFTTLAKNNPGLYDMLWHGPVVPSHYRLFGYASQLTLASQLTAQAIHATKASDDTLTCIKVDESRQCNEQGTNIKPPQSASSTYTPTLFSVPKPEVLSTTRAASTLPPTWFFTHEQDSNNPLQQAHLSASSSNS